MIINEKNSNILNDERFVTFAFPFIRKKYTDTAERLIDFRKKHADNIEALTLSTYFIDIYSNIGGILDIIEAMMLNSFDNKKIVINLIDALDKKGEDRDRLITELHDEIHRRDKEIKQFKKQDQIIKLIEDFFERKQSEKK
jgi:hypothetical protein